MIGLKRSKGKALLSMIFVISVFSIWQISIHFIKPPNETELYETLGPLFTNETYDLLSSLNSCKNVVKSIYYLKVHKTGSTTFSSILARFGLKNKASFALFRFFHPYPSTDMTKYLLPPPIYAKPDFRYNLVLSHTVYNKTAIHKIMPKGTRFVATIRHPLSQLISAFHHYGLASLLNLTMFEDPIKEFLMDPAKRDKLLPGSLYNPIARTTKKLSFTKNRMAFEFGFDLNRTSEPSYINEHMMELDKTFHLVIITEKYEESLLLLRKLFCWEYVDILYMKLRKQHYKSVNYDNYLERHKKWANLDYMLYDLFLAKHNNIVNQLGQEFQQEVLYFKQLLSNVTEFCLPRMKKSLRNKIADSSVGMTIPNSVYHTKFRVSIRHCLAMGLSEETLRKLMLSHQYKRECQLNNGTIMSVKCLKFTLQTNDPLFGYKDIVSKEFSIKG